jgi:predicted nucleic acid-binding protein
VRQVPSDWRSRDLLVDANILVLYLVGSLDPSLIGKHKRTNQFGVEDYHLLDDFLRQFKKLVTTPNVLTEASNMVAQIGGQETVTRLRGALGRIVEALDEQHVPSTQASKVAEFRRLGLTDAALLFLAKQGRFLVLTDDRHLYDALQKKGIAAINFHHLREEAWS